nr:hypothetical protein [Tanacetum cinerariifolium]
QYGMRCHDTLEVFWDVNYRDTSRMERKWCSDCYCRGSGGDGMDDDEGSVVVG